MHCRRLLLHRTVLTACNEAGWTALGRLQPRPGCSLLCLPLLMAPASVQPAAIRLLTTPGSSTSRISPQPYRRRRRPPTTTDPNNTIPTPRKHPPPVYTPYNPANTSHTPQTHPPLQLLHGSFHPASTYAILYKPANLPVSSLPPADSLERRLREGWAGVGGRGGRGVWFPHRLDKHTEGVMVVVFDGALNARMGGEIRERRWVKKYRLIGQLPQGVPAVRLAAEEVEEGKEEEEEEQEDDAEGKDKRKREAAERRLSKVRCSYLDGSLFTSRGLLPSGTLTSHLARRPPPPPATTIDFAAEEQRWSNDLSPSHSPTTPTPHTPPSTSTHAPPRRRRIHPFVPETMLYCSVPAARVAGSREAVSRWRLLDVVGGVRGGGVGMWEVELLTGRSHQLRVHWSDAGCPVVNDPYYNHRYVWQQVHEEKQRRARLAAGEEMQKEQAEASGEEQLEDSIGKPVVLVRKIQEEQQQPLREDEEEEEEQAAADDTPHSLDTQRRTATATTSLPTATPPRPTASRLTPLGPSFRILPPTPSRAFSTQQWQSVLDKYGVKSATAAGGGGRGGVRRERGLVDDVESMAELREAEEEATVRQMIDEKRQRKAAMKGGGNRQREVEELDSDDMQAMEMEEDETEMYPTNDNNNDNENAAHNHHNPTKPASTHKPRTPPAANRTPATTNNHPLASAGWLAMSSPTTRSPFATTNHAMRLQSYYLSIPHPTRPGYELTVVVPMPRGWAGGGGGGGEGQWRVAESEWEGWVEREKRRDRVWKGRRLGRGQ